LDAIFGVLAAPRAPVNSDGSPAVPQVNVHAAQAALGDEKGRQLLAQLAEHAAGLGARRAALGGVAAPPAEARPSGRASVRGARE
jgi:hypothetical protein